MSESTPEAAERAKPRSQPPPSPPADAHGHDAHHAHSQYPNLAHHFDSPQQQFDAGKLGIWLFLLTEVLFFAGLFCAYTVYRAMRPEVFVYAHYFLDTKLGALNTCVLLLSSLTAAWSVRNAQLKQTKLLVINIVITIACACTFMVVKYFEYSHKVHDGLLWGPHFAPKQPVWEVESFKTKHPEAAAYARKLAERSRQAASSAVSTQITQQGTVPVEAATQAGLPAPAFQKPTRAELEPLLKAGITGPKAEQRDGVSRPRNAHVFFSIYFFMTGLHGLHVLIGIGVWIWLLTKAIKGVFGPYYFGPIDYAALYWHLVDLIWIYLFPLLYLIH